MAIEGHDEYRKREFGREVSAPVHLGLDTNVPDSAEYERVRQTCRTRCKHTAWEFHHWLLGKGYLIVGPKK